VRPAQLRDEHGLAERVRQDDLGQRSLGQMKIGV